MSPKISKRVADELMRRGNFPYPSQSEDGTFPDVPDHVREAYRVFWRTQYPKEPLSPEATDRLERKQSDMMERNSILKNFVGDRLATPDVLPYAYTASTMLDIARAYFSEARNSAGANGLIAYFDTVTDPREDEHNAGFLGDFDILDNFIKNQLEHLHLQQPDLQSLPREAALDESVWKDFRVDELTFREIDEQVLKNVDIEAFYIVAADFLQQFNKYGGNSKQTLAQVYLAKSFFAPVLEGLGLDGFSSAMKNTADGYIYENSDDETRTKIQQARAIRNQMGTYQETIDDIEGTIRFTLADDVFEELACDHDERFGVCVVDGICSPDFTKDKEILRVNGRAKTLVSIFSKLKKKNIDPGTTSFEELNDEIHDFYAMTAILEMSNDPDKTPEEHNQIDEDRLIDYFAKSVIRTAESDRLKEVEVWGDDAWFQRVEQELRQHGYAGDITHEDREFTTLKLLTESPRGWSTELRFETVRQRLVNRYGERSHAFYKNNERFEDMTPEEKRAFIDDEVAVLMDWYGRRSFSGGGQLRPASVKHGQALKHELRNPQSRNTVIRDSALKKAGRSAMTLATARTARRRR